MKYSETSQTDHPYRSTTSLYGPVFLVTEIKIAVSFQCFAKFYKSTTSLNGQGEFTTVSDGFREVYTVYKIQNKHNCYLYKCVCDKITVSVLDCFTSYLGILCHSHDFNY